MLIPRLLCGAVFSFQSHCLKSDLFSLIKWSCVFASGVQYTFSVPASFFSSGSDSGWQQRVSLVEVNCMDSCYCTLPLKESKLALACGHLCSWPAKSESGLASSDTRLTAAPSVQQFRSGVSVCFVDLTPFDSLPLYVKGSWRETVAGRPAKNFTVMVSTK